MQSPRNSGGSLSADDQDRRKRKNQKAKAYHALYLARVLAIPDAHRRVSLTVPASAKVYRIGKGVDKGALGLGSVGLGHSVDAGEKFGCTGLLFRSLKRQCKLHDVNEPTVPFRKTFG